jgi:hypothetical protein
MGLSPVEMGWVKPYIKPWRKGPLLRRYTPSDDPLVQDKDLQYYINYNLGHPNMATAKTGSFYLTETVTLNAGAAGGTRGQSTIDLGAYVNVPTGQAVAIESVDFIYQTADGAGAGNELLAGAGALMAQLTDLNPSSTLLIADDQSLVASGCLNVDQANSIVTHASDFYPDNFGPASLSEAFMVVNDTLYLVGGNSTVSAIGTQNVSITVRVRCRVVKLSNKDWMAIAIQSTASDN